MEPYTPPRARNPAHSVPPTPSPAQPAVSVGAVRQVNEGEVSEAAESWITKHPILFLTFSGLVTAGLGVVVTHYLGGALRKREARAEMEAALAEAEVQEYETNPEPEPEPEVTLHSLGEQLRAVSEHFGVRA